MNKVAIVIPVYQGHLNHIKKLLDSFNEHNKKYADLFFVFCDKKNEKIFSDLDCKDWTGIVIEESLNASSLLDLGFSGAYVTFKKFYGLDFVQKNFNYEYSICIDSESIFIDLKNIYYICKKFNEEKFVYGGSSDSLKSRFINESSMKLLTNCGLNINPNILDLQTYFWFSQIPIYDNNIVRKFFTDIKFSEYNIFIENLRSAGSKAFENICYVYYCVQYEGFKIIDLVQYGFFKNQKSEYNSLEFYGSLKKTVERLQHYGVDRNWQHCGGFITEDHAILYHADRDFDWILRL